MCVVERRNVVGGAAVTEEFHPGFRNSTASYTVSLLDPQVIRDLKLARARTCHSRAAVRQLPAAAGWRLSEGRRRHRRRRRRRSRSSSRATPSACPRYYAMLDRVADGAARACCGVTPPNIGSAAARTSRAMLDAWKTRAGSSLARRCPERRDLLDLFTEKRRRRSRPLVRVGPIKAGVRLRRRSSAISRVPTRRAPRTCCCITCSAK